jgi:hypothetical protein
MSTKQEPQQTTRSPGVDGLAIASLVLGIVWVWWVGSILALIFGVISLRRIKRGTHTGKGMAIAGVVLGAVGMGTLTLVLVVAVIVNKSTPEPYDFGSQPYVVTQDLPRAVGTPKITNDEMAGFCRLFASTGDTPEGAKAFEQAVVAQGKYDASEAELLEILAHQDC